MTARAVSASLPVSMSWYRRGLCLRPCMSGQQAPFPPFQDATMAGGVRRIKIPSAIKFTAASNAAAQVQVHASCTPFADTSIQNTQSQVVQSHGTSPFNSGHLGCAKPSFQGKFRVESTSNSTSQVLAPGPNIGSFFGCWRWSSRNCRPRQQTPLSRKRNRRETEKLHWNPPEILSTRRLVAICHHTPFPSTQHLNLGRLQPHASPLSSDAAGLLRTSMT